MRSFRNYEYNNNYVKHFFKSKVNYIYHLNFLMKYSLYKCFFNSIITFQENRIKIYF